MEPILTLPNSFFERVLRYVGIMKRINIINHSRCDIRVVNDILVKRGETELVYFSGQDYKITVYMFVDHKWRVLHDNRIFDTRYDLNIYNIDINLAKRNKSVDF